MATTLSASEQHDDSNDDDDNDWFRAVEMEPAHGEEPSLLLPLLVPMMDHHQENHSYEKSLRPTTNKFELLLVGILCYS